MTIITYGLNMLWTFSITTAMRASQEWQPRLSIFRTGETTSIIQDYHLQRHHFQDTNWRIQSIEEIWIIRVFINAGTHSTVLSQYISIPAKILLLSSIHYQSLWRYGMDTELQLDLLDVPISMYDVVQNCRGFGHKPGNGRSVTVPVLPSNIQYTSLAASIMDCPRAS